MVLSFHVFIIKFHMEPPRVREMDYERLQKWSRSINQDGRHTYEC